MLENIALLVRGLWPLALFFAAVLGVGALLAWLRPGLQSSRRLLGAAVAFALAHLAVLVAWSFSARVDSDEVAHLHCSWLISQGLTPFKDFWQDHSPPLWWLLAPIVSHFHSASVLVLTRTAGLLLFIVLSALVAWLAYQAWRMPRAAILCGLLMFALGVRVEGSWLRPDHFANPLALVALALSCSVELSGRKSFLSGAIFGLALAFTPKPIFAAAGFPAAVLLARTLRWPEKVRHTLLYTSGGIAGMAPLFAVLAYQGIFREWFFWIFLYHAPEWVLRSVHLAPLALTAIGGCLMALTALGQATPEPAQAGALSDTRSTLGDARPAISAGPVLASAFLFQTLGNMLNPSRTPSSLIIWIALALVLIAPVLAVGSGLDAVTGGSSTQRSNQHRTWLVLVAVLLVVIEANALLPLGAPMLGHFAHDRARINRMLQQAGKGPVVLVTPLHDIYSHDATGLYELWQYNQHLFDPLVNRTFRNFAHDVVAKRPTLILAAPRRVTDDPIAIGNMRPSLLDTLLSAGIITHQEHDMLEQYIAANYTLVEDNGELYYVRRN